jgi:hypothetical protein
MPQVLERLVLQVQPLAASVQDSYALCGCTDTHTHTHTGGTSQAGEGVESRDDWEMKYTKEPKPDPGQNIGCERLLVDNWQEVIHCSFPSIAPRI